MVTDRIKIMKLIVGLGNPGQKYKNNRHNVGFMVIDELVRLSLADVVLFKPSKFMNRSGVEVKKVLKRFQVSNRECLFVVHDDLDIELGKFKISFGKGPKVHNGLNSIYELLGSKDFWHVRIGIDNRLKTGFRGTGEDYVLQNFKPEEKEKVQTVIDKVALKIQQAV